VHALCGISNDIPSASAWRRRGAAARSDSEAPFEAAAIGMGLVDPEGRWIGSRGHVPIVGYSEAELLAT
jgi:hypothetical protein